MYVNLPTMTCDNRRGTESGLHTQIIQKGGGTVVVQGEENNIYTICTADR